MSNVITQLFLANKNIMKPLNIEIEKEIRDLSDELCSKVGMEFFTQYEEKENLYAGLKEERAFKEGFNTAVRMFMEVGND